MSHTDLLAYIRDTNATRTIRYDDLLNLLQEVPVKHAEQMQVPLNEHIPCSHSVLHSIQHYISLIIILFIIIITIAVVVVELVKNYSNSLLYL